MHFSEPVRTLIHIAICIVAGAIAMPGVCSPLPLILVAAGEDAAAQALP